MDSTISDLPPLPQTRTCPFDPPPEYKQLRQENPICKMITPRGDAAWVVTRFEDIKALLVDRRLSSNPLSPGFPNYVTGDVPPPPGFFLQSDAPDQTRLRRAVTEQFMPAHVDALRPRMQQIFDTVLESMLKMTPPVDLVQVLAVPVAAQIICELLGVRVEDHPFVQSRTDIILDRGRTPKETEDAAIELMNFFDKIITEKELHPGSDLLSSLIIEAAKNGQPSHEELVGLAALILLSAYDTMALAIALGTLLLLNHPDQLADFLADPSLSTNVVDELVRYLSINHTGLPRAASADVEIAGKTIPAGEGVLVMINSGNRDETVFEDPNSFNIHRKEKSHLGFGHGLHKCLGVHFAHTELSIAFNTLFLRVPSLRVAAKVEDLEFRHEMVLYGLKSLPVTWQPEDAVAAPCAT